MSAPVDVLAEAREQMALAEAQARDSLKRYGRLGTSPVYWAGGQKFACRIRISPKGRETVMWFDGDPDHYWGGERVSKAALLAAIEAAALARVGGGQ